MRSVKTITLGALLAFAVLLLAQTQKSSALTPESPSGVQPSAPQEAAAAVAAPPDCGPGERTFERYKVLSRRIDKDRPKVDNVYIRHNPQGFALGTLFREKQGGPHLIRSDRIDVQKKEKGYGYGCTPESPSGHRRCGWVLLAALESTHFTGRATGPCSRRIQPEEFCDIKNSITNSGCRETKGIGSGAIIKGTPPRYGNYISGSNGGPSDRRADIRFKDREKALWRYVTPDGSYVLVEKKKQKDTWVFVPRRNVRIDSRKYQCGRCT